MKRLVTSPKALGAAIKMQRELKSLTQTDAGRQFKLAQSTLSDVERGNPNTHINTIFRILAALDLEIMVCAKRDDNNVLAKEDDNEWEKSNY